MSAPKGQSKSGTGFTRGNTGGRGSGGSVPQGQVRSGTSFTPGAKRDVTAGNRGGRLEGQSLRGYVHNAPSRSLPTPQDVTVAPDGTRRVKGDKRS